VKSNPTAVTTTITNNTVVSDTRAFYHRPAGLNRCSPPRHQLGTSRERRAPEGASAASQPELRVLGTVVLIDLCAGGVGVPACVPFEVAALNPPTAGRGCLSSLEEPLIKEFQAGVRHAAIVSPFGDRSSRQQIAAVTTS
jgi:hypothetical protein